MKRRETDSLRQPELPAGTEERLRRSKQEVEGLKSRVVRCPVCGFKCALVYSDIRGHMNLYCRKCKKEFPANLSYFRRTRARRAAPVSCGRETDR